MSSHESLSNLSCEGRLWDDWLPWVPDDDGHQGWLRERRGPDQGGVPGVWRGKIELLRSSFLSFQQGWQWLHQPGRVIQCDDEPGHWAWCRGDPGNSHEIINIGLWGKFSRAWLMRWIRMGMDKSTTKSFITWCSQFKTCGMSRVNRNIKWIKLLFCLSHDS